MLEKLYAKPILCQASLIPVASCCSTLMGTHPSGIIDLHLSQKFSIDAEVAKPSSLIVYDAVAFTGYRN